MKILYVEDSAKAADASRLQLQAKASAVKATHLGSLDDALAYLARAPQCDLLVTELNLPEGLQLEQVEGAPAVRAPEFDLDNQKVEIMGLLSSGVAHNLNNVLAGIAGYIELTQEDLPDDSPVQEHMKMMEQAIQSGSELCRQILAYSENDSAQGEGFDLNHLLHENSRLIDIAINKGTQLKLELDPQLPSVGGDRGSLKQVLLNLVLNAAEAIGEDQGLISIRTGLMEVDQEFIQHAKSAPKMEMGSHVYLEVQDSGPVISADKLDDVFSPSFSAKITGRGLSLAAVHDAVISTGGALSVTSATGQGSIYRVVFPRVD